MSFILWSATYGVDQNGKIMGDHSWQQSITNLECLSYLQWEITINLARGDCDSYMRMKGNTMGIQDITII